MILTDKQIADFRTDIWDYYRQHGRSFAWRVSHDPYHILVSECMLQQTQTYRVEPKYQQFLEKFPTIHALAAASNQELFTLWQGLGYNRRALFLRETARTIVEQHQGVVPYDAKALIQLPGIGAYSSCSVVTFAYNAPTVFIETNIRTVYIYTFFTAQAAITDAQLYPLVAQTLDHANPRHWYYALMDYGVMLKKNIPNPSRASAHHQKQSSFHGSKRQIRGLIVKLLTNGPIQETELLTHLHTLGTYDRAALSAILESLIDEQICKRSDDWICL
ncbi:MAG: hypothetical protein WCE21_04825 [Candidatus Babeliales bacterium]